MLGELARALDQEGISCRMLEYSGPTPQAILRSRSQISKPKQSTKMNTASPSAQGALRAGWYIFNVAECRHGLKLNRLTVLNLFTLRFHMVSTHPTRSS